MNKFEKYSSYKDSGVEWLGEIPEGWSVEKIKYNASIFSGNSISDHKKSNYENISSESIPYISTKDLDINDSSINYDNGLRIPKLDKEFKVASQNSTLLCIEGGSAGKKIAFSNQDICFVNKLACIKSIKNNNSKYIYYLVKSSIFKNQFDLSLNGLIGGVSLSVLKNFELIFPPKPEQIKIASFLDTKTEQLDIAIKQKEQLIELLKERRQILISDAVTKGIDKTVAMKDTDFKWLGKIPEHWELKALKYIIKERIERSDKGDETLFMMSQIHGLVVRSDYHDKAVVAQSSIGNKKVYKNDLVFNKLKAHLGVFSKSNIDEVGIVSPDYAVYYSIDNIADLKYLEYLFKNPIYISHFISKATGVVEGLIRLYTDDLFSLKVPVPPKIEQEKILAHIQENNKKIDKAIDLQQQEIAKLKEYKTTLIDSVVTGKMRVVE